MRARAPKGQRELKPKKVKNAKPKKTKKQTEAVDEDDDDEDDDSDGDEGDSLSLGSLEVSDVGVLHDFPVSVKSSTTENSRPEVRPTPTPTIHACRANDLLFIPPLPESSYATLGAGEPRWRRSSTQG